MVIQNGTIRKFGAVSYSHSIVTVAVSCVISKRQSDIMVENRDFFISPAFNALVRGVPIGIFP